MKPTFNAQPLAICIGAFIGCQLSTGCATTSSSSTTSTTPTTTVARPETAPTTTLPTITTSSVKTSDTVTFAEPTPTITITPRRTDRPVRSIGLYGELEEVSFNSGSPLDGGGNLAQITFATEGACVDPDIDRTGTWLAFASTMHRDTADIYIKSVTGKTQTQITTDPADDVMPTFSPDGKLIAFSSNRAGNWDIYTVAIDGGSTVQITNDADHELHPSWSPDGRTMAYCKFGTQSQRWEIWTVDVNSPGTRNFLEYGLFPQWCPDPAAAGGVTKIVFQRAKQRGSRDYSIWTIDIVGGQAKYPTEIVSAANAALINPTWSPDGRKIAFVAVVDPTNSPSDRPTQSDLWVVDVDGTQRTSLTNGNFANFQPVWANTGAVYFVSDRAGTDNVWAVSTSRWTDRTPTHTAGVTGNDAGTTESHP